jgi:hypothetical protein
MPVRSLKGWSKSKKKSGKRGGAVCAYCLEVLVEVDEVEVEVEVDEVEVVCTEVFLEVTPPLLLLCLAGKLVVVREGAEGRLVGRINSLKSRTLYFH